MIEPASYRDTVGFPFLRSHYDLRLILPFLPSHCSHFCNPLLQLGVYGRSVVRFGGLTASGYGVGGEAVGAHGDLLQ
jgi:hypothetical protein